MSDSTEKSRWGAIAATALFAMFALIMFSPLLVPGQLLFSTDNNIGQTAMMKRLFPGVFFGGWWDGELMGQFLQYNLNLTHLLIWALPLNMVHNWIHAFDLVLSSVFFFLFLRALGRSWLASVFGAIVAFWVGHFTLVYCGHLGKFGVLLFAALFLWTATVAAQRRSGWWTALAGAALGGMFMEQTDVGLFFAILLGFYPIHIWGRIHGFGIRGLARYLGPMYGLAILLALPGALTGYRVAIKDAEVMKSDAREKWNYVTQWSLPPEEALDLVAPFYHGIRTGEPAGPYWGRIGRDANWAESGGGLKNFRLDSIYLGWVPFLLAAWALIPALQSRLRAGKTYPPVENDEGGSHVRFFSLMILISIGLAMGKYSPLYWVFYHLPVVNSVRAPIKFLQVTQLALAVVSAFGFDGLVRGISKTATGGRMPEKDGIAGIPAWARFFPWAAAGLALVFGLSAISLEGLREEGVRRWAAEWGPAAEILWAHRTQALWHATLIVAVMAVLFALSARRKISEKPSRPLLAWITILLVAGDAFWGSRPYVQTMPASDIAATAVTRALRDDETHGRVWLLAQQGFYNSWLTYLFPYHGLQALNITQMPRMSEDYRRYLEAVTPSIARFWSLGSVTRLLGPREWMDQLSAAPELKDRLTPLLTFDLRADSAGRVYVDTRSDGRGQHAVSALRPVLPRFALLGDWEGMEDADILKRLGSGDWALGKTVLLRPEDARRLGAGGSPSPAGQVKVLSYAPGRIRLKVEAAHPAVLRFSEKYDSAWRATVDGRAVPVFRADYIAMGVAVPAGNHEVVLGLFRG